jgi:hypothetical protein
MENTKDFKNDVDSEIKSNELLKTSETGVITKISRNFKKVIYITSLAGMGLFLNSCVAGYIGTEPSYVEFSRPARPSTLHVWIDGDWAWNNQTHVYVQKTGHWQKPYQGQTYFPGYWQTGPKGKSWAPGHWQRQNSQGDKGRRK